MTTCLPFTGTSVWPLVAVAVIVVGIGFGLQRLAMRRRGGGALLLLILVVAAGLAVVVPRVDAHATTCGADGATNVSMSESQIEGLPVSATEFVPGGSIVPGQQVDVSVGGFVPGATFDIYIASNPILLGSATANPYGFLRLFFSIPSTIDPGNHNLAIVNPLTGVGFRQPVVVDPAGTTTTAIGGTTTSSVATTSTSTAIASNTTTTAAPTTTTTAAPTTTTTSVSTTTTTAVPANPQTVSWSPETSISISDFPVTLPPITSVQSWWGWYHYYVDSAGTAGCAVDDATRVLTATSSGTCVVRATSQGLLGWDDTSVIVTMTVGSPAVCDDSLTYQRGETGPGGGVIFYASPTCRSWGRFLEVAPTDWMGSPDAYYQPKFCDRNFLIPGASQTRLGSGLSNTYALLSNCAESPAIAAQAHRGGGMIDWFLPSQDESIELCKWVHGRAQSDVGCGGYSAYANNLNWADHYWTSTQTDADHAIEVWLPGGNDYRTVPKDTTYVKVHPIRAFGLASQLHASWSAASSRSTSRTVTLTLEFSDSVTGLEATDLANGGTATGCTFVPNATSGTTFTVVVTCTSDGSIVPILANGSVIGTSGTGPVTDVPGPAIWMDTIAPTLSISRASATMVAGTPFVVSADEAGTVHLVSDSITVSSMSDILGAADSAVNSAFIASSSTDYAIHSRGLAAGTYHLYAVDLAGNLSERSATGYAIRDAQACSTDCLVGDIGPGGGTVFYDAGSVQTWGRWLEAAPRNWHNDDGGYRPVWCDVESNLTGAMGEAIGDGFANTQAILAGCTSGAAVDAQAYRGGGQVDWFLPSTAEMKMLCGWVKALPSNITNCQSQWGGGYVNNDGYTDHYWTSTQVDAGIAVETWMPGGNDYRNVPKGYNYISARPIRAFGVARTSASIAADQKRSTSLTLGFTADFSESISGLSASDLSNMGTATGCTFTPASSSGASIHIAVVCTGDGTVIVRLAANSVTSTSGTGPATAVNSLMVPIDAFAPVLTVTNAPSTIVKGNSLDVSTNERSDVYMVSTSVTVNQRSDITGATDANWNSVTVASGDGTHVGLTTVGLDDGTYSIYAIDLAGNISPADPTTVTVRSPQSCTTTCLVGDIGPGGGRVVYDAGSVQSWGRYLEVAAADATPSGERPWCNTNTLIAGADGTAIGTGLSNSTAIAGACSTAAAIDAMAYRGGGLSDWFLPSADEMRAVCRFARGEFTTTGCGSGWSWSYPNNLSFSSHMWTSTQIDVNSALETWMPGFNDYRTVPKSGPGWGIVVRPVRYF